MVFAEPAITWEGMRLLDYRQLFERTAQPTWVHDAATGLVLEANAAACELYGYDPGDLVGMHVDTLCATPGAEDCLDPERRLVWHRHQTGERIAVRVSTAPVTVLGRSAVVVSVEDVTAIMEVEAALRDSEAQFREAQEIAHVGSWQWDVEGDRVTWSDELARVFGLEPGTTPSTLQAYLAYVHPDDLEEVGAAVQEALASRQTFEDVHRILHASGEVRWLRTRARVAQSADGRLRLMGVCQDVTDQKRAEEDLTRLALYDSLTGLPDRTLFMDRLEQSIRRLERRDGSVVVMFIDLDRFKLINDKLGHAVGDRVLRAVAGRLARVLRPTDTIARFGGDEFAILCEDLTEGGAAEVAGRIVETVSQPVILDGRLAVTGASVGLALTADEKTTPEVLLHDADEAMYSAKEAGRNRYMVFDNEARMRGVERLRRTEELRRAVVAGELRVFFQPDIDLHAGEMVGVEALVRWKHPTLGLLGADQFIDIAEESGLVVALGERVLEEACRQLATWPESWGPPPGQLAVNLSALQLAQASLLDVVGAILRRTGLAAHRLCLEITESVLMDDVDASVQALLGLRSLGVRLAVDDFGTGYSSLAYLRRLPVDIVKIDRSFVAGVGVDPASDAIVAAVVNLAHALGLVVVAEGVENDEQLVAVRALGCDRAQGFFWSQALPPEELAVWCQARHRTSREVEPLDVYELLAGQVESLRAATGRSVLLEAPAKLGTALVDRRAVRTVMDQVLANAVKYSPEDRPIIVTGASDRHWIRVSVADFGVGMTSDESVRCFEQFWQGPEARPGARRGTGIGLYIVRSLVEAMGGHIGVKSAKGRGTTFTFALPRSPRLLPRGRGPTMSGEDSSIREFMRQLGVPNRRGA